MAVEKALDMSNPLVASRVRLEDALQAMEEVFSRLGPHIIRERLKACGEIDVTICPGECGICPISETCAAYRLRNNS